MSIQNTATESLNSPGQAYPWISSGHLQPSDWWPFAGRLVNPFADVSATTLAAKDSDRDPVLKCPARAPGPWYHRSHAGLL